MVAVNQGIEFMRERKYDMKVWRINHFRPAPVDPYLFLYSLAFRAVAVTAGIVVDPDMSAVAAPADIHTECPCFAAKDGG